MKAKPKKHDNPILQVIADHREKEGWWNEGYLGPGFRVKREHLDVGDYTIEGMEDYARIERKESLMEVAMNVGNIDGRKRFSSMLKKLASFPFRAFIITDTMAGAFAKNRYASFQIPPSTIINWLFTIHFEFGIPVLLVGRGEHAKFAVRSIFRRIAKLRDTPKSRVKCSFVPLSSISAKRIEP